MNYDLFAKKRDTLVFAAVSLSTLSENSSTQKKASDWGDDASDGDDDKLKMDCVDDAVYECSPVFTTGRLSGWQITKERFDKTSAFREQKSKAHGVIVGPNSIRLFKTMVEYLDNPIALNELYSSLSC